MAQKHILTLILVLLPSAGRADCEGDARRAREMILASGPFEYKSRQWNEKFDRLEIGLMEPNKYHIVTKRQNNQRVSIGEQSWENDGFGWLGPRRAIWDHSDILPQAWAPSAKCLGTVVVDERSLIGYEQNAKTYTNNYIEKLFVEPGSGLTVRYERVLSSGFGFNVVSTYRYDASIKIEPPKVDLAERQRKSLQAFELAATSADPRCRQEVIDTIDRGQTTVPFQYEIVGRFWNGVSGMHGTFVPPGSVHNIVDGIPYHGGGSETLTINGQAWKRLAGKEWVSTSRASPLAGAVSASWSGPLVFPSYIIGVSDFIGGATCLGEVETRRGRLRLYGYELYRDSATARKFVIARRVFVDPTTGLPAIFDDLDHNGQVVRHENRLYDKGITLTPPVIALDRIGPKALPQNERGSGGLY
jgi:hypothetical protein